VSDQKTEQATPRRLEKAREEGNFPISAELLTTVTFLTAVAVWAQSSEDLRLALMATFRRSIESAFQTGLSLPEASRQALVPALSIVYQFSLTGACILGAALAAQLLQAGFRLAPSKLAPDLGRLNPLSRLLHLPGQNLQQLVRALLLLPVVAWLVQSMIANNWSLVLALPLVGMDGGLGQALSLIQGAMWRATAVLVVISLFDVFQRRRKYAEDLKMSKQEIRDESKEAEGNMQAKAHLRRMMRDLLRRRMMSEVPKATAVIVNPTHYAVAIRYVPGESVAPKVVAKGKNFLAARIRKSAEQHGVPVVENPPLARALYRGANVGQEIPAALYRAVAEVLAYVYRMTRGGFNSGR
jgi:flagellar biosynthesis protein FlhB